MGTKANFAATKSLPQLGETMLLTDGGIETTLIFHDGFELPHFAAFDLLGKDEGRKALTDYYQSYLNVAQEQGAGFILESPTWRASLDWGEKFGLDADQMRAVNEDAIFLMRTLKNWHRDSVHPILISGCIGPRGDGYDPGEAMSISDAHAYHTLQAESFARAGVDMITAITMTNVEEATGLALAAKSVGVPVVISFTVETDGTLPTGQPLGEAIEQVDAATDNAPAYYMINCAHPDHFRDVLEQAGDWRLRIRGVRANASRLSHAELDEAEELDDGNPAELAQDHRHLMDVLPNLRVFGGCCGTDHRHVAEIGKACVHHSVAAE